VTGAGGLLGGRLATLLHADGFTVVGGRHAAGLPSGVLETALDLLDPGSVARALEATRAEAVLHSAVLQVDACEARPAEAEALNHRATGFLARACRVGGLRLVALSTDLVFAGDRRFVSEEDAARPTQVYGRTKLAGEEAALAAHPDAVVARVALVVGRGHGPRGTASEGIAWALRRAGSLRLFADEYRTPVDPESVARALALLLRGNATGRFHLGGPERVSRYELGLRVARALGLPTHGIEAARQAEHVGPARPPDVSLDITRARRELGWAPRPLDEVLAEGRAEPGAEPG
jgi:dTDP-4-dehydrorhamnose reductase